MADQFSDLQIVIPYDRFCDLMEAARALPQLREDFDSLNQQHDSLRSQFFELMDAFGDLRRTVSD